MRLTAINKEGLEIVIREVSDATNLSLTQSQDAIIDYIVSKAGTANILAYINSVK